MTKNSIYSIMAISTVFQLYQDYGKVIMNLRTVCSNKVLYRVGNINNRQKIGRPRLGLFKTNDVVS